MRDLTELWLSNYYDQQGDVLEIVRNNYLSLKDKTTEYARHQKYMVEVITKVVNLIGMEVTNYEMSKRGNR